MYLLVLDDSLKGAVHVVKIDEYIDYLSNYNLRRNEIKTLTGLKGSWSSDIFYANHYLVDGSHM